MNRPHRSIEIFTMSALDLFITAMGSFAILMMILFPYSNEEILDPVTNTPGNLLFCVWPTRVQDYEQFVKEVPNPVERGEVFRSNAFLKGDAWRQPGYELKPDLPVANLSWSQAQAFCRWLTKKERAAGTIGAADEYRLPTWEEWRIAAGPAPYPWGRKFPPPARTGNFADETWARGLGYEHGIDDMQKYDDGFEMVAPVGSFKPNRFGLFDMAGNVMQWCQNPYRVSLATSEELKELPKLADEKDENGNPFYVLRGSTWENSGARLKSDDYGRGNMDYATENGGFRCVLVVNSQPRSNAAK